MKWDNSLAHLNTNTFETCYFIAFLLFSKMVFIMTLYIDRDFSSIFSLVVPILLALATFADHDHTAVICLMFINWSVIYQLLPPYKRLVNTN